MGFCREIFLASLLFEFSSHNFTQLIMLARISLYILYYNVFKILCCIILSLLCRNKKNIPSPIIFLFNSLILVSSRFYSLILTIGIQSKLSLYPTPRFQLFFFFNFQITNLHFQEFWPPFTLYIASFII